jgi:hypothetical protein
MKFNNVLAVLLLVFGVFGSGIFDLGDLIPKPEPVATILNITKPSEEILERVQIFSDTVTDPDDRAKLAIFNYEFASRIMGWECNNQQVNDVYSMAGKIFFESTLSNKYENLADELKTLFVQITSDEFHVLSVEEKEKLSEYFMGIAWVLTQKG